MFKKYFNGEEVDFNKLKIDWSFYTDREREVIDVVRRIPYGQLFSYQKVAEKIGNPYKARFVGNVMKKNRTPIVIPCHRIIRKDGRLGNFGWGVQWKRYLLKIEKYIGL